MKINAKKLLHIRQQITLNNNNNNNNYNNIEREHTTLSTKSYQSNIFIKTYYSNGS